MPNIPDSIGLTQQGLSADKPFVGSPTVVDGLVRGLLKQVTDLRADQLAGKADDITEPVRQACRQFQEVFYGRDPAYTAGPWNSERHLGNALVIGAGMEGETADAVERLALRMIDEYLAFYLPYEADELPESEFQWRADALIEFYMAVLMGMPYDDGQGF